MVKYPGHKRIASVRARLEQVRRNADEALTQAAELRRDVDGLRAEIKRLSIDVGQQLATHDDVIDRIERRVAALEAPAEVDARRPETGDR
jgi:hypothetical protein